MPIVEQKKTSKATIKNRRQNALKKQLQKENTPESKARDAANLKDYDKTMELIQRATDYIQSITLISKIPLSNRGAFFSFNPKSIQYQNP